MTIVTTTARTLGTAYGYTRHIARQIDWAESFEIAWHGLTVVAVMTYLAGHALGTAVHAANDRLAAFWRRLWVTEPAPVAEPTAEPVQPVLAPPAVHPLALIADDLLQHTRRELNAITGIRSKAAKAQLVALAVAC